MQKHHNTQPRIICKPDKSKEGRKEGRDGRSKDRSLVLKINPNKKKAIQEIAKPS